MRPGIVAHGCRADSDASVLAEWTSRCNDGENVGAPWVNLAPKIPLVFREEVDHRPWPPDRKSTDKKCLCCKRSYGKPVRQSLVRIVGTPLEIRPLTGLPLWV